MTDLDSLLASTSRTFALAIPLLPEPLRREVTIAYLLFRIADTFEDAAVWPREERLSALASFVALVRDPSHARADELTEAWCARRPSEHEGYLELLRATPEVLAALEAVRPDARAVIVAHTIRTTEGMAGVVTQADREGGLRLTTVEELRGYCYLVAGIVGELLTDLFLLPGHASAIVGSVLRANAIAFGEGLQLVNILKDSDDDAADGRTYLPSGVSRAEVIALAREDLDRARVYVLALQAGGADRGVVAFTALPVLLARATLDRLAAEGPGAKIPRSAVAEIMIRLESALGAGSEAVPQH